MKDNTIITTIITIKVIKITMAPVDRLQVRGGPARSTLGEVPGPRQTHLTVFLHHKSHFWN